MYFNEINILDQYSVEWKSAYVGVYQLLNWKMHGETLKLLSLQFLTKLIKRHKPPQKSAISFERLHGYNFSFFHPS